MTSSREMMPINWCSAPTTGKLRVLRLTICSITRVNGAVAFPTWQEVALRPAGSLSRPRGPLSRGSSPCGYPHEPLVSYRINRQLSEWNLPPLVIRAFGALCQKRTNAPQQSALRFNQLVGKREQRRCQSKTLRAWSIAFRLASRQMKKESPPHVTAEKTMSQLNADSSTN